MGQFDSIKGFSKEVQGGERKKIADALRAQRKEYFTNKGNLQQKLQELQENAESKKIQAAEVRVDIENTESSIEKSSKSLIRRLLERSKVKRLEASLGTAKVSEATLAEELNDLGAARLEIEQSLQDRTALSGLRQRLDLFYQKTEEDWNNYEDDREAGDIKNIMKSRNTFLVHAFKNPAFSPSGENGLIRKEIGWQEKLDLLALEPTLSASAVDKEHPVTFAPVGVLLNEGQVLSANSGDIGSKALEKNERTLGTRFGQPERIRDQVTEALRPYKNQGWTEFVVSNPKVAGLFFRLDANGQIDDLTFGSDTTISEVVRIAQERNLPLFALQNGEFRSISLETALTLNEHSKIDLKKDDLLTPDAATELPAEIDEFQREAILERLMTNSPFQLNRFPEALQVASRAQGRSLYNLYQGQDIEELTKEKTTIPAGATGNVDPLEVTILKTVSGPTHLEHLVRLADGKRAIWKENRNPISPESRFRAGSTYLQDSLMTEKSILLVGPFSIRSSSREITDIIEAAKKEIEDANVYLKKCEEEGSNTHTEQWRGIIKNIAASIFGIAEEAKGAGDTLTAERAQSIASEFFPLEEYQTMVARRVSESGTFQITREELLG